MTDKEIFDAFLRRIKREKIIEPRTEFGEYVDKCPWSKTGWAVWKKDGSCTCRPAHDPNRKPGLRIDGEKEQSR